MGSMPSSLGTYFNAAAQSKDPVERMKLVIAASFAFLYPCHTWDKPLSPMLGETYQATM